MIGERLAAQSRGQNWQRTFQSPSVYLFRCVPFPSLSRVTKGLKVLRILPGNGERACRSAQREWRLGAGHITVDQITLVALEHVSKGSWQPHFYVNVRSSPALYVPPSFHSIYYFIPVTTHAFVRLKMLFLVCYSPTLDLILYLPHLYLHNPTHQCDRSYILYRHTLRTPGPVPSPERLDDSKQLSSERPLWGFLLFGSGRRAFSRRRPRATGPSRATKCTPVSSSLQS
jgi:hypothetical protein